MITDIRTEAEAATLTRDLFEGITDFPTEKYLVKRARRFKILENGQVRNHSADFEIHFSCRQEDGVGWNSAKMCLMPEEYSLFLKTLMEHEIPLPTRYKQQLIKGATMYCLKLESFEAPEQFIERLAAALKMID